MKILISGGTGFLGKAFSEFAYNESSGNAKITWLSRDKSQSHPNHITMMSYKELLVTQESFDVVLNLAGAGIADKRWSESRKRALFDSRLKPTQSIIDYIARIKIKPNLLISGSAIGWYGVQNDIPLTENSGFNDDFAHQLCDRWEVEAKSAQGLGVEVIILRTGVVIHPNGGMLKKLLTPFSIGMGGKLGSGKQIMSWISLEDWVQATWFVLDEHIKSVKNQSQNTNSQSASNTASIYNLTAPHPISNEQFTTEMGNWLNRPTVLPLPSWVLKCLLGEMSTLLLDGQKVLPQALLDLGYEFKQPTIHQALIEQK